MPAAHLRAGPATGKRVAFGMPVLQSKSEGMLAPLGPPLTALLGFPLSLTHSRYLTEV